MSTAPRASQRRSGLFHAPAPFDLSCVSPLSHLGGIRVRDGSDVVVSQNVVSGPWPNSLSPADLSDTRFGPPAVGAPTSARPGAREPLSFRRLWDSILRGGYPGLFARTRPRHRPLARQLRADLSRAGLRTLRQVEAPGPVPEFLAGAGVALRATPQPGRSGRNLGVAVNTAKAWLSVGSEVDFVVESGVGLIPIEVKLSATPRAAMASGIRAFCEDLGARVAPGVALRLLLRS